jgi:mRNA-degrading endonuclease RelE of RelBE toxin-antitoxin system
LYKIKYFDSFNEDLYEATNYIEKILKNEIASRNLYEKIRGIIENRASLIVSYKKYYTKANNVYYKININNYSVFYTIKDDIFEVRRFLYNRMNFEKMNVIC